MWLMESQKQRSQEGMDLARKTLMELKNKIIHCIEEERGQWLSKGYNRKTPVRATHLHAYHNHNIMIMNIRRKNETKLAQESAKLPSAWT